MRLIKCSDCSYTCGQKEAMENHIREHKSKKNLKCGDGYYFWSDGERQEIFK